MAPFRCLTTASFSGLIALLSMSGAFAITSKDVTDKMSQDERFGYLTGIVDTISYQSLLAGNKDYAQCVSSTFYKNKEGTSRIIDALHAFPDKAPVAVLLVVLKRACDK